MTWTSRSRHFLKSNTVKTVRLKDKATIAQDETIPNMEWYYMYVWWSWLTSKMCRAGLPASAELPVYCATLCASAVFAVHQCLSVRLSRCSIISKRLKISSNFFLQPVAPPFYYLNPQRRYPIPKATPSAGAQNKRGGWEIFAIFDWNRRLSRIRYAIGPWLLWKVNRKPYTLYRMVTYAMTLTDLDPVFKVTAFLKSNFSKTVRLRGKVTKNTNRKPHLVYWMVPVSMTLIIQWLWFQGRYIFRHWISQKLHEIER